MRIHRDPTETVTARLLPNWKLQPFAPERIRRSSIDRRREDARGDSECVAEHVRKMSLVVESGRERHAYGAALAFLEQAAGRVGAHRKDRAPTSPRRMRVSPATIAKEPISARHSTTPWLAIACWKRLRRPRQPAGVKRSVDPAWGTRSAEQLGGVQRVEPLQSSVPVHPCGRYSVPARCTHWCRAALSAVRLVQLRSSPSCLCPRAPGCGSGTQTARAWGRRT